MLPTLSLHRPAEPPRGIKTALVLAATFVVMVVAAMAFCEDRGGDTSFWPANGVLVAGFLVLPRRYSLGLTAFACAVNLIANLFSPYTLFENVLFASLNCSLAITAAIFARSCCGAAVDLSRFRRFAVFVLISTLCAFGEAALGEVFLRLERSRQFGLEDFLQWVFCDSLGLIIGTPAVLLTLKRRRYALPTDAPTLERCLLLLAALILTGLSFALGRTPLFLFIYPVLILLAFRAGPAFVLTAVVLVAMIASGLTAHGLGPLAFLSPNGALLHEDMAQPYLISLLACALPANNALGEKARAAARIQRAYAAADAARQQAVRANAAKSDFIANVSHEIRTPLNGVLGMTQALAREDLTASQRARLDVIQSSGEVLLSLLNDVLDFSKIEAGKLELETAPFDVGRVAQGVAETFEDLAREKGLSFRLTRVEPFAGAVLGDAARVRQILSNLVSNALKFTSTGSVEIRVTALDGIILEVIDTGIGVPADKISTLFAKFEQVDATTTRRFGGTGLGLSISRELARMMGGQISVESELGAGSRFRVDLPLASDPNAAGADHHAFEADGLSSAPVVDAGAPLRILAAEDNKTNQLVLTTLLADLDVDLTLVDDGLQAIQTWRDGAFDLILMDMQMPVMDGMTAIREIRSAERAAGRVRVPIIAFTADVMSHHLGAYRAAGVDGVVAKPVRFEALVAAIEAALNSPDEVKSAAG